MDNEWTDKRLSPSAIADDEYLASVAKDLAANEWTPPPPRAPAPRSDFVTGKKLGPLLEKIGRLVGQTIRESCERLEKRIAELEQREWVGIYTSGKSYAKNSIVSHDGSCWLAVRQYPEGKPGAANSGWKLIVKRGRDGRDAK